MKITLVTARPEDSNALSELMNDREIYQEFLKSGIYTQETASNEIEFFRSKKKNSNAEHFLVLIKLTKKIIFFEKTEVIGFISNRKVSDIDSHHCGFKTSIHFGIKSKYRNRGRMTEALYRLMNGFMKSRGIRQVNAYVLFKNAASQKVLSKLGFVCVGESFEGVSFTKYLE